MLLVALGIFSVTYAVDSDVQDQTIAFIKNALPLDFSSYNVTLARHSTDESSPIVGITGQPINCVVDRLKYTLESDKSNLHITFLVQNNVILSCNIYIDDGEIITDHSYTNLTDAVTCFLEKYQTYTKTDLSNMVDMLTDVDLTKNLTTTIGDNKLVVSNINIYGIEQTSFKWIHTINGADYTSLQFSYQDGNLCSIRDDRAVYTIGDTSVDISREQAIDIAMDYLPSYSYEMPNGITVSGFNVTKDLTTSELATYPVTSTELRPYWNIKLYLNQTYPGSVKGLALYIWANSGEVFYCGNLATGGVEYDENPESQTPSKTEDDSASGDTILSPDMLFVVGLGVIVIGIATTFAVMKKRKK